ncbi:HAD hydrolase family protein [Synechococcus sp. Tobar12-5m-g]|jgi:hydroxymethylpyrimidine pyrophosphatase-like HAD family hydrolase|uniref:HAD family hydrolase n=1 Tax=unclassified Synechococcus TaxID=2626047 RepID=UPI0020CE8D97|nr:MULTISPECIES: HAD family hydrolase [unclassified Synechococcus]MCP9771222.1 HAD hydrolase family protein [Synechococcus sp. Tobar12-5m-g]MCP9872162.1 HAD hydrolase family protein [Synechococcus sp. Cruz CV-v-12]
MADANAASRSQFSSQISGTLPERPELVLVMDLDGTLLGGTLAQRRQFYSWLEDRRDGVLQIFSTGRDLAAVRSLLGGDNGLPPPTPHLVIGDVGSTVACGLSLETVPIAVDPIEAQWQAVQPLLDGHLEGVAGLSPQLRNVERRYAFNYEPQVFDTAILSRLELLGVDCLLSDERFLDVLPAGVNKGTTLLRLLDLLDLPHGQVVTAGDTLNDLAMFRTGLNGVMVGNAEPKLRALHPELENIYLAEAHGCGGIAEGLRHFGLDCPV